MKLKPFNCDHCDFASYREQDLNKPINTVHLELRTFKSEQCDHTALRKYLLIRHIETKHLKLKIRNKKSIARCVTMLLPQRGIFKDILIVYI